MPGASAIRRRLSVTLREEAPPPSGDTAAIRALLRAAFGGEAEAELVDRLRAEPGAVRLSLLAERRRDGRLVGQILFSAMAVGDDPAVLALAPLAVAPEMQRQGIGAALVRRGLALCRRRGLGRAVLVLGEPDYYGRYGFSAAAAREVTGVPWAGHPAFQARSLRPSPAMAAAPPVAGDARYACAFGILG